MTTTIQTENSLLRTALRANFAFCGLSGLASTFAARPIADLLGIASAIPFVVLGIGLVMYAGWLYTVASRQPISLNEAWMAIGGDVLWVVGSIILLALDPFEFTTSGKWIIAIIADIVALFAIAQYVGVRRL